MLCWHKELLSTESNQTGSPSVRISQSLTVSESPSALDLKVEEWERCQLRQLHLPRCDQTAVDQPENGLNGPDPGRLFTGQQSTGQHVPHSFRAAALNTQPVTLATEPHATFHTYLLFYILTPTIFLNHHKIDTV